MKCELIRQYKVGDQIELMFDTDKEFRDDFEMRTGEAFSPKSLSEYITTEVSEQIAEW